MSAGIIIAAFNIRAELWKIPGQLGPVQLLKLRCTKARGIYHRAATCKGQQAGCPGGMLAPLDFIADLAGGQLQPCIYGIQEG